MIPSDSDRLPMSSSVAEYRSGLSLRIIASLVLISLLLTGLYSAGWFYLAGKLRADVGRALSGLASQDITARCEEPETYGYPFSIGMRCDAVVWDGGDRGLSVSAGGLRAEAAVYDPAAIDAVVESPERIVLPGLPPLDLNWKVLTTQFVLADPLPRKLSVAGSEVRVDLARDGSAGRQLASLGDGSASAVRKGEALEIKGRFHRLRTGMDLPGGGRIPDLDGAFDASLPKGAGQDAMSSTALRQWLRGQSGELREATLSSIGTGISATGPFEISADGEIDARLNVTIRNPKQMAELLARAFPAYADQIATASGILGGLSGGDDSARITLDVRHGRVYAGFIPLGTLPAL